MKDDLIFFYWLTFWLDCFFMIHCLLYDSASFFFWTSVLEREKSPWALLNNTYILMPIWILLLGSVRQNENTTRHTLTILKDWHVLPRYKITEQNILIFVTLFFAILFWVLLLLFSHFPYCFNHQPILK